MNRFPFLLAALLCLCAGRPVLAFDGQVIDGATQKPVAGATIIVNGASVLSDAAGNFSIPSGNSADPQSAMIRAPGYLARTMAVPGPANMPALASPPATAPAPVAETTPAATEAAAVAPATENAPAASPTENVTAAATPAAEPASSTEAGAAPATATPVAAAEPAPVPAPAPVQIALTRFTPKALYLSSYGVTYKAIREAALDIIHKGDANAMVIDVKGDRGMVAFPSQVPLVAKIGADKAITMHDLPKMIADFHAQHIYTIARIVTFKDNPLANAFPNLAVRDAHGDIFHDREGLAWVDAFHKEAWDYNSALAVEAAKAGFDEIQFDYVRFPDTKGVKLSQDSTVESRTGAIDGFLAEARKALAPYNVYVGADVFGYITWNTDDTHIGQKLPDVLPLVDYLSPMLYPSGFQDGIPGYRDPVAHPYEIIKNSLDEAVKRTKVSPLRFRPWLQAFRDYAFDHRVFAADEVKAQTKAAADFGSDGWMLWNARNTYSDAGF